MNAQPRLPLPGMNHARNARAQLKAQAPVSKFEDVEVFFVRGLSKDGDKRRVLVLSKEQYNQDWEISSADLFHIMTLMPTVEGKVTGILIRQGAKKMAYNRMNSGGWKKINIAKLSVTLTYNK